MSSFPKSELYKTIFSKQHLHLLPNSIVPFILKKSKDVYLYDIDNNKYVDFFLDHGSVFLGHTPAKLTIFIKNALSHGMNTQGIFSKFLYKSTKNWQKITRKKHVSFYNSFIDMLCEFFKAHNSPIISHIVCNSKYIQQLIDPLSPLIRCTYTPSIDQYQITDDTLLLFEDIKKNNPSTSQISSALSIKIHSRFLFRRSDVKDFSEDCFHYIDISNFGGRKIGVLAGKTLINYIAPDFDNSILFLECSKLFEKKHTIIPFNHPLFECHYGYAICKQELDINFFLQRGIFLQKNTLYFSSKHTIHDLKRLYKALNEYFNQV